MIVSIWVYFMLGDPTPQEPGIAYVQVTTGRYGHDHTPEKIEEQCQQEFATKYPGHPVCECGWKQQQVKVMGE